MFDATYCIAEPLALAVASYGNVVVAKEWQRFATIQPENFGFVLSRGATLSVAICGTRTLDQWMHDFDAEPVANPFGPGRVHAGFMSEYQKVRSSIWATLERVGYDQLIIVGHSLGGPMACYCAADIAKNAPQFAARVTGYTFESPKAGDSQFVADFNQKFPAWWRVQNIRDIIPTLPPPPIFTEHEGTTIWVDGGFTTDVHVAHGLTSGVLPGLKAMIDKSKGQTS